MNFLDIIKRQANQKEEAFKNIILKVTSHVLGPNYSPSITTVRVPQSLSGPIAQSSNSPFLPYSFSSEQIEQSHHFFQNIACTVVETHVIGSRKGMQILFVGEDDHSNHDLHVQSASYERLTFYEKLIEQLDSLFLCPDSENKILTYQLEIHNQDIEARLDELKFTAEQIEMILAKTVQRNSRLFITALDLVHSADRKAAIVLDELKNSRLAFSECNSINRFQKVITLLERSSLIKKKMSLLQGLRCNVGELYKQNPNLVRSLSCIAGCMNKLANGDRLLVRQKVVCLRNLSEVCNVKLAESLRESTRKVRRALLQSRGIVNKEKAIELICVFMLIQFRLNMPNAMIREISQTLSGFRQSLTQQAPALTGEYSNVIRAFQECAYHMYNLDSFQKILNNPPLENMQQSAKQLLNHKINLVNKFCLDILKGYEEIKKEQFKFIIEFCGNLLERSLRLCKKIEEKKKLQDGIMQWIKKIQPLMEEPQVMRIYKLTQMLG